MPHILMLLYILTFYYYYFNYYSQFLCKQLFSSSISGLYWEISLLPEWYLVTSPMPVIQLN